jgi:hypothetical protein
MKRRPGMTPTEFLVQLYWHIEELCSGSSDGTLKMKKIHQVNGKALSNLSETVYKSPGVGRGGGGAFAPIDM